MRVSAILVAASAASIASFSAVSVIGGGFEDITESFLPHARVCLGGDPMITLLFVVGHLMTAMSYIIIPGLLVAFAMLIRRYPEHDGIALCFECCIVYWPIFASFIFFCGGSHFLALIGLYSTKLYWLEAAWILFGTGVISAVTAAALLQSYGQAASALAKLDQTRLGYSR